MSDTDKQILDIVARGFVLPEGLERHVEPAVGAWWLWGPEPRDAAHYPDKLAHDLCAAEFARQVKQRGLMRALSRTWDVFKDARIEGNSAAAIGALWEAVCDAP